MSESRVSVVIVPRERFSHAPITLGHVLADRSEPFDLVVVDGGSPAWVRRRLEEEAARHGFPLLGTERWLSPNAARNLGFARLRTPYAAFIDNDVVVEPGWLAALVRCAEETGADVVGACCLVGPPEDRHVHLAGGEVRAGTGGVERTDPHGGTRYDEVRALLRRERCGYAEFHAMLVRSETLRRLGGFDEGMTGTREHLDFCLQVARAGGSVWFEPASVVTYVPVGGWRVSDVGYYERRWGAEWIRSAMARFSSRWEVAPDAPALRESEAMIEGRANALGLRLAPATGARRMESVRRHGYAQTIPRLLNQVRDLGWTEEAQRSLARCYRLAVRLFADAYRANGKPTTAHLVGTASVLAAHGAHPDLVRAGLLHAAYFQGRFPGRWKDLLRSAGRREAARRLRVRKHAGAAAERLVHLYAERRDDVAEADRRLPPPAELDLDLGKVTLLYLANEVEETLDLGPCYASKPCDEDPAAHAHHREVARLLGFEDLALEVEAARAEVAAAPVPASLRSADAGSRRVR